MSSVDGTYSIEPEPMRAATRAGKQKRTLHSPLHAHIHNEKENQIIYFRMLFALQMQGICLLLFYEHAGDAKGALLPWTHFDDFLA